MTIPSELPRSDECSASSTRSRIGKLMGVRVVGMGSSIADKRVRNEDLAALGYDADWIVQRTGITDRRHASENIATRCSKRPTLPWSRSTCSSSTRRTCGLSTRRSMSWVSTQTAFSTIYSVTVNTSSASILLALDEAYR